MSETKILRRMQVALSVIGRFFRNQVGKYQLADGRWLSSGLAPGSSDLIGWVPTKISSDMVGKTVAIFATVEVKTSKGRLTNEQKNFLEVVRAAGGIAVVARSEEEALEGIRGIIREWS